MNSMRLIFACFLGLAGLAVAAEPLKTNARLPEDGIIFPQPGKAEGITVAAMFKSDEVISQVVQGNWVRSQHLITYEVLGEKTEDTGKELKFICHDSNPAPESQIRAKKVPWPFHGGSMTFTLSKDESCAYMPYFNILRYEALLRDAK